MYLLRVQGSTLIGNLARSRPRPRQHPRTEARLHTCLPDRQIDFTVFLRASWPPGSLWGSNLRGDGGHWRRVFLDAYFELACCGIVFLKFSQTGCGISRVLDHFSLRIHCTPPVLFQFRLKTSVFYRNLRVFYASRAQNPLHTPRFVAI